jgi:protein-tyrosine phosphatase
MASVLFICTANRYRSPIAAACFQDQLLKRKEVKDWHILSAGTWTTDGLPAVPEAIRKARQFGLDIQEHRSCAISTNLLQQAGLILVMEQGQKEALQVEFKFARPKVHLLTEVVEGIPYDIPDPMNDPGNIDVVSVICELIQTGFDKIFNLAAENEAKLRST